MNKKVNTNRELLEVMEISEKEKDVSKDTFIGVTGSSLLTAYKNHFGKADSVKVTANPSTCGFVIYAEEAVVENVGNDCLETSLADIKMLNPKYKIGDAVQIPLDSKKFGCVTTQNAENVILQKIHEEERRTLYSGYYMREKDVMTGVVQRYLGRNVSVNLGRVDAILNESEQIKDETFRPTKRIKVYAIGAKDTPKGPRVSVPRAHPGLVKRLFESKVVGVRDGTAEIKAIAREAGSRTEVVMKSNDANMDPVDVCVSLNGSRVNSIVNELKDEKIDVINRNDNPAYLIENALSPAKVICVVTDKEEREAQVIVPGYQLPLAVSKESRNAKLATRLTGFKIGIKSGTQAREMGPFERMGLQYGDTLSEACGEETEETESYRKYEESYQESGSEQQKGYSEKVRNDVNEHEKSSA